MPNDIINELIFSDVSPSDQDRILAAACVDGKVDFSILVPVPLNIWQGSVGKQHDVFKANALDWARQNWGTKWNAYAHVQPERAADSLTLRFQTAWSPPYPWLAAMLNKLALPFYHNWLDEGAERGRHGAFKPDGEFGDNEWSEIEADEPLHRHLHKLLWGVEEFEDEER